jgi:hypothetical protein
MTGTLQILLPYRALERDVITPAVKEKLTAAGTPPTGGDVKVVWDSENADEVELARVQFDRALAKGMAAFRVTRKGEKGEQIRRFDPEAEAIIMAPALRGG